MFEDKEGWKSLKKKKSRSLKERKKKLTLKKFEEEEICFYS
jgi:hypothetical protein